MGVRALVPEIVVVGLDLSLTGAAAVSIRHDWFFKRENVKSIRAGYSIGKHASEEAKMDRLIHVARHMIEFVKASGATHVFVENYAFGAKFKAPQLGEICGIVKSQIYLTLGMAPVPVPVLSVRKLLCGKIPQKAKKKEYVAAMLKKVGFEFDSNDEMDAFVVANWGLSKCGLRSMTLV